MKKHGGNYRGFIHLSKAWYGINSLIKSDSIDEVTFGFYSKESGTSGEMSVCWSILMGNEVPKLEVFDDAWDALYQFRDVLQRMADEDDNNISPARFCEILRSCGFKDITPLTRP